MARETEVTGDHNHQRRRQPYGDVPAGKDNRQNGKAEYPTERATAELGKEQETLPLPAGPVEDAKDGAGGQDGRQGKENKDIVRKLVVRK